MWVYGLSFLTEYEKGEPIQDRACWKQEFAEWLGTWTLKSDTTGSESKPCHLTACILLELFICPVTQFLFCLIINITTIDAFELWCWRRLLRVPWTARRSNQTILKEISRGCSLEGLMLRLKLQYFGHLMQRVDSLEKTDAGRYWGQEEKGTPEDEMAGWHR